MQTNTSKDNLHNFCDRAIKQIDESSTTLRNALEALPHAFYIINAKTYIIEIANSATAIFGDITKDTTCHSLTHNRSTPCDGKDHMCPLIEVSKTKKPAIVEHVHYDHENKPRIYEIHAYPICDNNGELERIIEYSLDITDRKKAEEMLQSAHDDLEKRVGERVAEIKQVNAALHKEIAEHKQTEEKLMQHQQKLRSVTSDLTITEERQRRQLAIDLHDGIGQALAMSQMKIAQVKSSIQDAEIKNQLDDIQTLLEDAIQQTRSMTFELSPPLLYEIGLDAALEWLTETFQERHGIQTTFHTNKPEKIKDDDVRLLLYRIARELLINVVKHARAGNVKVMVQSFDHAIQVEIIDDGVGFDPKEQKNRHQIEDGFGLFSIGERLEFIGGQFQIISQPGHGTRALISAPLLKTRS